MNKIDRAWIKKTIGNVVSSPDSVGVESLNLLKDELFENHSDTARSLGFTPEHGRLVRRTGRMSLTLRILVGLLVALLRDMGNEEQANTTTL